jgi:hypothetical protein
MLECDRPRQSRFKVIHMAGNNRAKSRTITQIARPGKKQKSTARPEKKAAAAPQVARARVEKTAAAPLLAAAPKKVGKVTGKRSDAVKPAAPYQPKAEPAPLAGASRAATTPLFDPFALAQVWLRFGTRLAIANLTIQARVARAIMDLPPTAAAMRQSATAYKAGLAILERTLPAKR